MPKSYGVILQATDAIQLSVSIGKPTQTPTSHMCIQFFVFELM